MSFLREKTSDFIKNRKGKISYVSKNHKVMLEIPSSLRSAPSRLNCGLWFAFIAASNTFIVLALRGWI